MQKGYVMISQNSERSRRTARRSLRLLPVAALAFVLPAAARAQGGGADPNAAYRQLMQHRMEESQRSVNDTARRRFEEGKPDGPFPSDANKSSSKAGVVRAASPEEQRALSHNERGLEYFSKGKLEQAVKEYGEAIRAYPSLAAAHNNLGSAYFAMSRFEESVAAFRDAVQIEPNYGQAHFNLALAYIKLGREREANDALMNAVRAYDAAGETDIKAGRLKEAEESFKGLLQIDPNYTLALLKLGLVCNADRRYEEAVQYFRRVLQQEPTNADAFESLGESYYRLHKYDESLAASEQAIKLRPNATGAYYLAGLAHASLGQRDLALANLARLKELAADDYAQLLSDFIDKKSGKQ